MEYLLKTDRRLIKSPLDSVQPPLIAYYELLEHYLQLNRTTKSNFVLFYTQFIILQLLVQPC